MNITIKVYHNADYRQGFDKALQAYKKVLKKEITKRIPRKKLERNWFKKIIEQS